MSSDGAKFSLSFGGKPAEKPAAGPAPKSNLELLMAKAKAAPSSAPKAKAPLSKAPSASLFADDSDDEDATAPPPDILAGPSRRNKLAVHQSAQISRAERRAQAAAQAVDQSIFDYDTHYDLMKEAEREAEDAKKVESEERKPKYIESFLASAQTRKLDKLRAEEKMLEREREKEGDEFEGKEKFVTEAYKKQMDEVRKAEEEEKAREEALRNGKKGPGLTAFYKNMLDSEETKHAAAVAATTKPAIGPSLAIRPPTAAPKPEFDDEEEYDPFLAREAKASGSNSGSVPSKPKAGSTRVDEATGKEVEINDEGEVVDKRSLLKAGLNIMTKPAAPISSSSTALKTGTAQNGAYVSRAVGSAASHRERMEREKKRLAEQMQELEEKKRKEEEERKRNEEEEARKRREGDNGEAERKRLDAKERYLARKRAKEEEDAARKKAKAE